MRIEAKKERERGLTLIEFLITLVLSSFLILTIVALYSFDFNLFSTNVKDSQLQNEANIAIEHITKQIRRRGVVADVIGANDDWLRVVLGSGTCQYRLIGDELRYCDTFFPWCGASSLLVAKNISQINFSYDSTKKIVRMEIELSGGGKSLEVESQVRL